MYTTCFWATYTNGTAGTIRARTLEAARLLAKAHGDLVDIKPLPYPALPVLSTATDCSHIPAFCLHGDKCAGYTACPRRYSCCE